MTTLPPTNRFTLVLAASVLGSLVFGLADLYWGFASFQISTTGLEKVLILAQVLGRHALVGLAFGLVQWPLLALPTRGRILDPRLLGYAAAIAALVVWALADLHEGPKNRGSSSWQTVFWGVRVGIPVAILAGLLVVRPIVRRMGRREGWSVFGVALALALLAGSVVVARLNVRILPGLYPGFHLVMAFLGLFVAAAGVAALGRGPRLALDRPGRAALCTLAGLVAIGASVVALRHEAFFPVKGALVNLAPATASANPWTNHFYDRFVVVRELSVEDMAAEVRRQREAGKIDVEKVLGQLPGRKDLNVLLIALDTVRADHTGIGGYTARPTTPNLDRFVREDKAFHFSRAYTPYPTSSYTYVSVLTGMHPGATPLHDYRLNNAFDWDQPDEIFYPKLFSTAGLKSVAVTAIAKPELESLRYFGMLKSGFDAFNPDQSYTRRMNGPEITDSLIRQLQTRDSRRFFAFAHYIDAHAPYVEREDFPFGSDRIARYDAGVAYVDREFGRIRSELERLGLWDNTIVVVFSDHGEGLGDHGYIDHNTAVYESQVRVPLAIRVPGLEGRTVEAAVSLTDLLPSVTQIVGIEDAYPRLGIGFVPWMLGYPDLPERTIFTQLFTSKNAIEEAETRCVVFDGHKLIERVLSPQSDFELYDLRSDPDEKRNLFRPEGGPPIQAKLLGLMAQKATEVAEVSGGSLDADPLQALRVEIEGGLEKLASDDRKVSREGAVELRKALLDRYDELTELADRLEPERLVEINARVLEAAEREAPGWYHEHLRILGILGRPESIPYCRRLLAHEAPHVRYAAALALSRMGPDAAPEAEAELLKSLETTRGDLVARFDAVMALSRVGRDEGVALYAPYLRGDSSWENAPLLAALTRLEDPAGLEVLADRFANNEYFDYTTRVLALDYAAATSGPDSDRLLLAIAGDLDAALRTRARETLAQRHGVEGAEEMIVAYEFERESRTALSNGEGATAAGILENYVAKYPKAPVRVWMMLARAWLCVDGHRDDVARALRGAADAGNADERRAAERMLEHLDQLAWFYDPRDLVAKVTPVVLPKSLRRARCYGMQVELTNTGDTYWPGGRWTFDLALRAKLVDAEGRELAGLRDIDNPLPPSGVAPGETVRMIVVGWAPGGRWEGARIAVSLYQSNNGRVSDDRRAATFDPTFDAR